MKKRRSKRPFRLVIKCAKYCKSQSPNKGQITKSGRPSNPNPNPIPMLAYAYAIPIPIHIPIPILIPTKTTSQQRT